MWPLMTSFFYILKVFLSICISICFKWPNTIPLYTYIVFYLSVHLGLSSFWATVNICVYFVWVCVFIFLRHMSRSRIGLSYLNSKLNFLLNCELYHFVVPYIVYENSSCSIFLPKLVTWIYFIGIFAGVKYITVILICISLIAINTLHLPVCLWQFTLFSLEILCPFFTGLFDFWSLSCKSSLYILDINSLSDNSDLHVFSHILGVVFYFIDDIHWSKQA